MINKQERRLLGVVDSEFSKAKFNLFKASIYLEKIGDHPFEKTVSEIKKVMKDLDNCSGNIIDFLNKQDFPGSI